MTKFSCGCRGDGGFYIRANDVEIGKEVSPVDGAAILRWMLGAQGDLTKVLAGDSTQVVRDLCDEIVEKFEGKQATMTEVVMYLRDKVARERTEVTR